MQFAIGSTIQKQAGFDFGGHSLRGGERRINR